MVTQVAKKEGSRSKQADKRQAIIEAARNLFTTVGYENTTIAEVAKQAGVAVGTVYLYFKTKQELLQGVKGNWDQQLVAFMAELDLQSVPYHLRARPLIAACFEICERFSDMVQLMGMQAPMIGEDHDIQTGHEGGLLHETIKAFFDEAIAAGVFRPVDSKAAAILAFGMVNSALHQCFDIEGGRSQQKYIDTLVDAMGHWLLKPEILATFYS